jgi:hypothetical protein
MQIILRPIYTDAWPYAITRITNVSIFPWNFGHFQANKLSVKYQVFFLNVSKLLNANKIKARQKFPLTSVSD